MRNVCVIFWTSINLVKGRKLSTSLLRSSKQQKKNVREKEREVCWVQKFCAAPGHEFYSEIPLSFIRDPVTTATICDSIDSPYVEYAIKCLKRETIHVSEKFGKAEEKAINGVAEELYNLLHGRYVLTDEGLKSVRAKYDEGVYGQCLRVFCRGHPLLPVGLHDRQKESTVKCFCPKCRDIYNPQTMRNRSIDGVAFGTSLPHLMLQRMPELATTRPKDCYVPRLFGFKIHESAPELQVYLNGNVAKSATDLLTAPETNPE
jgi:casein kinase II subunit beta